MRAMGPLDYTVFVAYLAGIVMLGILLRRRGRSGTEFFLAGRTMGWFPIGLSVMVTAFSAINYNAVPTEVFRHGLYVVVSLPVFFLVGLPVTRVFMPFYHGMRLTSAYEYLERRFDVRVRCLASALFILWRLFWMGTALYASSAVLRAVTGFDLHMLIVLAGAAAVLYTALGGMRAVMWTDVAQFFVLAGGVVLAIGFAVAGAADGPLGVVSAAAEGGRLRPFVPFDPVFLSLDPRVRITVWSGLIGTFVAFLARYGADQVVVQRYFTARSLRDARRGYWLSAACAFGAISLLVLLGLAVFGHAVATDALGREGWTPVLHLAALVASLPPGMTGVVAAGLLAATMSSVDSGINSCAAAWLTDFHERVLGRAAGPLLDALLVALFGGIAIGLAFVVEQFGGVFQIANRIINGLGSPLLALMLLGMFSRRANGPGMFVGGLLGAMWSVWVSFGIEDLALHYYAVLNLVGTLSACYVCSVIARLLGAGTSEPQAAWTWRARAGQEQLEDGQ
jgi:SSS family transporter